MSFIGGLETVYLLAIVAAEIIHGSPDKRCVVEASRSRHQKEEKELACSPGACFFFNKKKKKKGNACTHLWDQRQISSASVSISKISSRPGGTPLVKPCM